MTGTHSQSSKPLPRICHAVVATNADKHATCEVFGALDEADARFRRLKEIYGGAHVSLWSRQLFGGGE